MIDRIMNPVSTRDFISTISLEYSNAFAVELYEILSILAVIDHILSKYLSLLLVITIKIDTNYQSVIDIIQNQNKLVSMLRPLYQIVREIKYIKRK